MKELWNTYKNGNWVEPFLILSTCLFIAFSIILYLMIVKSRNNTKRKDRLRIKYETVIEKLMLLIIFKDFATAVLLQDKDYMKFSQITFFREVLMDAILNLHKNYEGTFAKKLEQFYKHSGLMKDSFKKLRSPQWEVTCKAITELAEMNITKAFKIIITISKSNNKTLKITAINACVKLGGAKGILHLSDHIYPIDDWTQVNIIHAFKKHDMIDMLGVELLLESQNMTVIALGLKLIKELKLSQKVPFVEQLIAEAPNATIEYEAQNVLQALTV